MKKVLVLIAIAIVIIVVVIVMTPPQPGFTHPHARTLMGIERIRIALQDYYNDWSVYPDSLDYLLTDCAPGLRYLDEGAQLQDSWGSLYAYIFPGKRSPDSYDLYSFGPNGIDEFGENDDITALEDK